MKTIRKEIALRFVNCSLKETLLAPSLFLTFLCSGVAQESVKSLAPDSKLPINKIVATIPLGSKVAPIALVVSPDSQFLYVCSAILPDDNGIVSVINTATNTVTSTITVGYGPNALAITPDGNTLYVANYSNSPGTVSVISTANHVVTKTLKVAAPFSLAVSPDGKEVYVTNANSADYGTVSVIDTATNQVLPTRIKVGALPADVVFSPDGNLAYVLHRGYISLIDTLSQSVTQMIVKGTTWTDTLSISPDGDKLFVSLSKSILVIDTSSDQITRKILVADADGLGQTAITPNGRYLYVPSFSNNTVLMIDTVSNQAVGNPIKALSPSAVAVSPNAEYAYVTDDTDANDKVSVVNIRPQ